MTSQIEIHVVTMVLGWVALWFRRVEHCEERDCIGFFFHMLYRLAASSKVVSMRS